MTSKWTRKVNNNFNLFECPNSDLFLCHKCSYWLEWVYFCKGMVLVLEDFDEDNTYQYMNDDRDRDGCLWACDNCIQNVLDNNKLILYNK